MPFSTVKTIHLEALEVSRSMQVPFQKMQYSTLNEDLQIEDDHDLPPGEYPKIGYLAIGNGGHRNVQGGPGESLQDILQHGITDAALFNQIPFVMRRKNNDLTATEREKYRLRRLVTHNNEEYFAYYLRKFTPSTTTPVVSNIVTVNGVTTVQEFTPSASMLSPTPVTMENGQVVGNTGRHISVQIPVKIELDATDIQNIIDAVEIITGDIRNAVISEVAIVSGIDVSVTRTHGGIAANYTELIAAQCCNFIGANSNLNASSNYVAFDYDIGSIQPELI